MRCLMGLVLALALGVMGCSETPGFAYEECPGFPPLGFEPCRVDLSCSYGRDCDAECCAFYDCVCPAGGNFSCSHTDWCNGGGGGAAGVGGEGGQGGGGTGGDGGHLGAFALQQREVGVK
jgi:hypothetical protein